MALETISKNVTVKDSIDKYATDIVTARNTLNAMFDEIETLRAEVSTNTDTHFDNPVDLAYIDSKIDAAQSLMATLNTKAQALN